MSAEMDDRASEAGFDNGGASLDAEPFDEAGAGEGPAPERQPTTVPLRALPSNAQVPPGINDVMASRSTAGTADASTA